MIFLNFAVGYVMKPLNKHYANFSYSFMTKNNLVLHSILQIEQYAV